MTEPAELPELGEYTEGCKCIEAKDWDGMRERMGCSAEKGNPAACFVLGTHYWKLSKYQQNSNRKDHLVSLSHSCLHRADFLGHPRAKEKLQEFGFV
jgi:hypothetical protein